MTWLDLVVILLIVGYTAAGFFTGLVRRAIGLVALWVAFLGATHLGQQAGGILQQSSGLEIPDSRIYGFFGIVVAVLIVVEGAGQLAHSQIQIPALSLNRTFGVLAGLITAIVFTVICVYELGAAANPFGGSQLDPRQQSIRDAYNGSHVIVPIARAIQKPIIALFQPALPGDPQIYFGPGPVI